VFVTPFVSTSRRNSMKSHTSIHIKALLVEFDSGTHRYLTTLLHMERTQLRKKLSVEQK
jgi:hypothetical protein